ncbi:DUF1641 domain-containing protein [Priestia aryabhattai]|uniref:DUF1641 domain-containing protein n=1 Tax=Priestia aryabhattai TaxID=412384 RepID=UPI001C0C7A74|nr:DUF1641 domain-containing protein [Priestia aryabhattai]MBU3568799.1 DUF1641 domain-containing protein [Priestia aryabhattai]
MGKAITNIERYIPSKEEEKQESIQQILDALSENRDAVLTLLDILKELKEFGMLDIVQGALKNRHDIGVIAVTQLNKPGMHHMMKTGMDALQFLSRLEPQKMQTILQGVEKGIEKLADTENNKSMGLWGMGKAMFDPNVSLALGSMMNFMRGMGEGMKGSEEKKH